MYAVYGVDAGQPEQLPYHHAGSGGHHWHAAVEGHNGHAVEEERGMCRALVRLPGMFLWECNSDLCIFDGEDTADDISNDEFD